MSILIKKMSNVMSSSFLLNTVILLALSMLDSTLNVSLVVGMEFQYRSYQMLL